MANGFRSLQELQRFVADLRVPAERREIVEAELLDHFFARVTGGASESDSLEAFGNPEALRLRFEAVEPEFQRIRAATAWEDGCRMGGIWMLASIAAWFAGHLVPTGAVGIHGHRIINEDDPAALHLAVLVCALLAGLPRRVRNSRQLNTMPPVALLCFLLPVGLASWAAMSTPFLSLLGRAGGGCSYAAIHESSFGLLNAEVCGPLAALLLAAWAGFHRPGVLFRLPLLPADRARSKHPSS